MLARNVETKVMSSLGLDARKQNLTGAIRVCPPMAARAKDARILIIDDVYTTGSTADACAEALLAAGAAYVDVFVFAIGADGRNTQK
jgi:predicted amidophosphoribosyltransferase